MTTREREQFPASRTLERSRKILLTIGIVAVLGGIASVATYSAFSSDTTSAANVFAGGTVKIGTNDAGSAMYSVANRKPGDTVTDCIKVTYTGTLDADVKVYAPDVIGTLGRYLDLTITPGTQSSATFPSCTGFTADGPALFTGTLEAFQQARNSWANGLVDNPGSASKWAQGEAVVYQFKLTLQDNNEANAGASEGFSTGSHRFIFEARNQ